MVMKRLLRGGSKNFMQTLAKNWTQYRSTIASQFDPDRHSIPRPKTSIAVMREVPDNVGSVTALGKATKATLDEEDFKQVITLWSEGNATLARIVEIYKVHSTIISAYLALICIILSYIL